MKVTAVTRFKHGALWQALKQLGWSQKKLSEVSGIGVTTIRNITSLRLRPSEKIANKLQAVLGDHGFYLDPVEEWPQSFKGFKDAKPVEQTAEISEKQLESAQLYYQQLAANNEPVEYDEDQQYAIQAVRLLPPADRMAIEHHVGLGDLEPSTFKQVGCRLDYTSAGGSNAYKRGIKRVRKLVEWKQLKDRLKSGKLTREQLLELPPTDLLLPSREAAMTRTCLCHAGIQTIGQLIEHNEREMIRYRHFGEVCLTHVRAALNELGLEFRKPHLDWRKYKRRL